MITDKFQEETEEITIINHTRALFEKGCMI